MYSNKAPQQMHSDCHPSVMAGFASMILLLVIRISTGGPSSANRHSMRERHHIENRCSGRLIALRRCSELFLGLAQAEIVLMARRYGVALCNRVLSWQPHSSTYA